MTWQIIWQLEAKGIAIMGLATLLAWFLRRSTGARRHAVWVASLVAVAFLPLLQVKGPELPSPTAKPLVLAATLLSGPISLSEAASIPKPKTGPARTVRYAAGSLAPVALPSKAPQLFALLWLAASLLLFCRLIWGTLRARAMLVGAATILSPKGCRVMAVDSPVPATIGWFRPIIMLPKASFGWPSEKTEAVLGHELAHVRRKDWLWQCMSQVVCAVFWFNPLVWYAAARVRTESELAADDLVILEGHDPADYAETLLAVAREAKRSPCQLATVCMARSPKIESRLQSILDKNRQRGALSLKAIPLSIAGAVILCGVIAGVRAEVRGQLHLPNDEEKVAIPVGDVVDSAGKPIPNAKIYVLVADGTHGQLYRTTAAADSKGHFDLTNLPLGPKEKVSALVIHADGYGLGVKRLYDASTPLRIQLPPPASLKLRVLKADNAPAEGLPMTLRVVRPPSSQPHIPDYAFLQDSPELEAAFGTKTDSDGVAIFKDLPEGGAASFIHLDQDYAPFSDINFITLKAGTTDAGVLVLSPGALVEGTVTADGKPMSGIRVAAQGTTESNVGGWGQGVTDGQGHYRLTRLVPGDYNIIVDERTLPDGWTASAKENVTAKPGEALTETFQLVHGGILDVSVDADKESLSRGVMIGVYGPAHPQSSAWVQGVTLPPSGHMKIRVPAGNQYVYIMNMGGGPGAPQPSRNVAVGEGETVSVKLP